jgi:exopolysaccharide production protein ExoQ
MQGINHLRWSIADINLEEIICAVILAFFAVQGSIPFIAPNEALEMNNAAASSLTIWGGIGSQCIVYGTIICFLLHYASRIARYLHAMQWTLMLALFGVASTLWSQFPSFTARRSIPFILAGLFGLYLAVRFPVRRQLAILWLALITLTIASIGMALCFPKLGLDSTAGHHMNWQGVFTQKNTCGRMMVLATAVIFSRHRRTALDLLSLALFLLVLVMSGSRAAWLIEAALLAMWCTLTLAKHIESRGRVVLAAAGFCMIPILITMGIIFFPILAPLLGRDATLSGRTDIWRNVLPFVLERPLLGWGYAAFWRGIQGEAFRVVAAVRFIVIHAHNGFLEIWLELGLVGLAFFLLSYLRAWRKLWPVLRTGQIDRAIWMVFVLFLVAAYDLDENTLLLYNGVFWVLYVSTVANIELFAKESSLARVVIALEERNTHAPLLT